MGKNRSASGLTNIIQYDDRGNITFVSGSTTLMSVSSSGAITTTGVISGSNVQSASLALDSNLLQGTGSVGFTTTASFAATSGSASSRLTQIESVYATTGSNSFRATQSITGSLTVTGQIIAQTLNVQQVTSSIVYSSGSNVFGCDINSRQTFTGSMFVTGSNININTTGVGVGTLPSTKLHVCGGSVYISNNPGTDGFVFGSASSFVKYAYVTSTNDGAQKVGLSFNTTCDAGVTNQERLKIVSDTGVACFSNTVCAPRINVSNTSTVLLVEGTATNGEASINLSGKNSSGTVRDAVFKYDNTDVIRLGTSSNIGMQFETNDVSRFRLTSAGIACFACQVCAPSLRVQSAFADLTLCGSNTTSPHLGGTFSITTNQDGNGRTIIGNAAVGRAMYLEANGAVTFNCPTTVNSSLTATSMTVATDCSGVIVDVAGRHGLMKYFNYGTGLIGACSATDGGISMWMGRFAGTITSPTAVYQDLRILNNGIASFSCRIDTPGLTMGSIGHHQNYRSTSGCFAIFCASQGAILYVTSMHNNGRSTAIVTYANGITGGAALSIVNQVTPYGPASMGFGVCANGWVYGYQQYGGPTDYYAIQIGGTFNWAF